MFRFTITLFVLSCLLTGYRLVGEHFAVSDLGQRAVISPSTLPDDAAASEQPRREVTPAPTVAPLFRAEVTGTPDRTTNRQAIPVVTPPVDAQTAVSTTVVEGERPQLSYPEVIIYADELAANWTVEHSSNTKFNLWDTTHWFQQLAPETTSGATAIAVSPQADYGTLLFTVRPESTIAYARNDVLGISFWLNSGRDGIATADLAVTVLGSNTLPYWSADDHSVFTDQSGSFSETRLYFLGINRMIPADTWVNVVVWLNKLEFDPPYQYVTGFYLKSDVDFRSTYYLDQVALIMAP